jgi:predicted aspartyl protease
VPLRSGGQGCSLWHFGTFLLKKGGPLCSARSAKKASIITANGVIETPLLKIKEIIAGEIKVKNVEVVCLDLPELAGIEGLLGLTFLDKMETNIDYKNRTLEIRDP